jgi:lysophospholipid acyltransferase (LPLAT)-like uncharacterized protein
MEDLAPRRGLAMFGTAGLWGHLIGAYARHVVAPKCRVVCRAEPAGAAASIWVCFHEDIMIGMAAHRAAIGRPAVGVVPGGPRGRVMAAWFRQLGIAPVEVAQQEARRGLRKLVRALRAGSDVLLAVDGPAGPRRQVKPGAIWLAAMSGAPLLPTGMAARPAIRLPRWDRLLVPLPGARIAVRVGPRLQVASRPDEAAAGERLRSELHAARDRAGTIVGARHANQAREGLPWR